jgi:hypothetical protein
MEILTSLLAFPAFVAGVLLLAVPACTPVYLSGTLTWLRLPGKVFLYFLSALFLFLSYSFLLSAALATSYLFFLLVFNALFASTSFLLPLLIVRLLGVKAAWYARSVAAFGYAIVLLTFSALLISKLRPSTIIPEGAILFVALVVLGTLSYRRLRKARWPRS